MKRSEWTRYNRPVWHQLTTGIVYAVIVVFVLYVVLRLLGSGG